MKLRTLLPGLICLFFFSAGLALAADAPETEPQSWRLLADRTAASHDNKYIEAFGNVVLDRGADYIRADYARYYQSTKWVFLRGNVEARFQGDFLKAEEAEFDLASNTGWLKNGQVFMEDPHMYFEGAVLKKTGPETYEFREATVTVCDGDRPAWSIKTSRGDITVDGYAHLWAPRFQILDQPVLMAPYAVIPVKTERQSGFLLPEIGTSERLGITYDQPYYQVIDEEQDVTLYSHLMTAKGLMLGGEYRLVPDIHTKGIFKLDYLFDQETEDTSLYSDNPEMSRKDRNRWWARGKFDGYLGEPDWNLKLDLDLVSDQDYLREFSRGYSGFNKSRKDFLQYFGRDIEDNDSELRVNRLLLSHNWANVGVQGLVEYTQNLEYGSNSKLSNKGKEDDPTLQRLPELNLHLYQTQLLSTPLTIEGSSQLASFWREYGTTGSRLDVHPVLGLPLHFEYGSVIPKGGLRGTTWFVEKYEGEDDDVNTDDTNPSRFLPDFTTSAYTEFSRVFTLTDESDVSPDSGSFTWLKLRHAVQPRLEYTYIPYASQGEYPYFDEDDRIRPTNELTYSLTNIFTTKTGRMQPSPDTQGKTGLKVDYLDLARLRLEQSFDIREDTRTEDTDEYPNRPFSDVLADLTTRLSPWLYLTNKTWYSPYENHVTEHEHALWAYYEDRVYASFSLDFLEEIDEYLRQEQERERIAGFGGGFGITKEWSAAFLYRVDWESGTDLEKRIALRYDHQCFSTETAWTQTDDDTRFEFRVILAQLGSVGR
ncbi:LPS-assembly protein LptD [Desulfomicrobium escambiense]|uniref:LPS-assembly protein LptD n=1 Tax=Desulfomicrobium escambiense TaxID=29503 RepID=UPI0006841F7B|nr:LPS assembly protein LptD [Desulfomicrobium escambiense]